MNLQETVSKMFGREVSKEEARQLADDQFGMLASYLKREWETGGIDPYQIAIVWCTEDIQSIDASISDEDARAILQLVKNEHDAHIGVNWETLEYWIDYYQSHAGKRAA